MITEITMWKVEGFSEPFKTKELAEYTLAIRNLAGWLEARTGSPISEDDAWDLASQLKKEFCMIPRAEFPRIAEGYRAAVEGNKMVNVHAFLEHIKNVY